MVSQKLVNYGNVNYSNQKFVNKQSKLSRIFKFSDDAFLAAFIRGSKGSLQKTKSVLENFNAVGLKYPELFGDLDPLRPRHQNYLADA